MYEFLLVVVAAVVGAGTLLGAHETVSGILRVKEGPITKLLNRICWCVFGALGVGLGVFQGIRDGDLGLLGMQLVFAACGGIVGVSLPAIMDLTFRAMGCEHPDPSYHRRDREMLWMVFGAPGGTIGAVIAGWATASGDPVSGVWALLLTPLIMAAAVMLCGLAVVLIARYEERHPPKWEEQDVLGIVFGLLLLGAFCGSGVPPMPRK